MLETLLDAIFPQPACCTCRQPGRYNSKQPWCQECEEAILRLQHEGFNCEICGKYLQEDTGLCIDCKSNFPSFDIARAVGPYEGKIRIATKVFKFMGRKYLAPKMGEMMALKVMSEPGFGHLDLIVPVPIAPNSFRERGFNQTDLLGRQISKDLGIKMDNKIIKRVKDTPHQTELTKQERERNLLDAFEIRDAHKIKDKSILLVDDVYTTGSTIRECTRVLTEAGAGRVSVVTWATGRGF